MKNEDLDMALRGLLGWEYHRPMTPGALKHAIEGLVRELDDRQLSDFFDALRAEYAKRGVHYMMI